MMIQMMISCEIYFLSLYLPNKQNLFQNVKSTLSDFIFFTLDDFPTPNFGRPLFKPSKSLQALQISILEM